ncbi:MAG TPA: hypothetical protein VKZ18_10190 [Polyangia bacterium]|nr:hypothetical protein [Polyangia bacterium]
MLDRYARVISCRAIVLGAALSFACARASAAGGSPAPPPPADGGPTTLPAPPPAIGPDRALGTAHPTRLLGASRDGSWVAICQVREDTDGDGRIFVEFGHHGEAFGDRLVPYLVLRPGPGREITRFLRSDPTGRWLVYLRDGKRWLLDARSGRELDLDAARPSADRDEIWRAGLGFDDQGQRLLFVAAGAHGRRVAVLRRLADGQETELDAGPGLLWWASFAKEGPYVLMRVVERDTNGNGTLEPPQTITDRDRGPCSTSFASAMTATTVPDELSWWIARIGEPAAHRVPGFETVFGDAVVRRTDSGALALDGKGPARELFPAACGAQVAFADPSRDTLVVSCAREGNALYVLQGGRRVATGCQSVHPGHDHGGGSVQVTCTDAAGRKRRGFLAEQELEIRILNIDQGVDGTELVRSALAGPGAAWQRRDLLSVFRALPKVAPPNVEVCSRYLTLDLESGEGHPAGERWVTRGTTSGKVLAASGPQTDVRHGLPIGPLFWTDALDPDARCPTFEQKREELYRRHPTMRRP